MSLKPCFNELLELVHRANDLAMIEKHSSKYKCYEIDVQLFDDTIRVYHDDMDGTTSPTSDAKELGEFLNGIPASFLINVEIKAYKNRHYHIENLCSKVADICGRRNDIHFLFSSFCIDVFEWFIKMGYTNVMMLADTVDAYRLSCMDKAWVCVDAQIVDAIKNMLPKHQKQRLYLYNVKLHEIANLVQKYETITGCIFDF